MSEELLLDVGDVLWLQDTLLLTTGPIPFSEKYRVWSIVEDYVPGVRVYELEHLETGDTTMIATQEWVNSHGKRLERLAQRGQGEEASDGK